SIVLSPPPPVPVRLLDFPIDHELPAFSLPTTGGIPSAGPVRAPAAGLRRAASHGVRGPTAATAEKQRRLHERMLGGPLLLLHARHVLLISHSHHSSGMARPD
ncbi:unnamed protein product, partial [Urochloa humidicola]